MDFMRKSWILVTILLATSSPVFAMQLETITLDTAEHTTLSENVIAKTFNENGMLLAQTKEDEKIDNLFIQAPKDINENSTLDSTSSSKPTTKLFSSLSKTAKDIYNLQIEQTVTPVPLLKDKLTFDIEKGPLESLHLWSAYQMNFSTLIPEKKDTDSKFDLGVINILIDGKFKGGKEGFRIMLDPTHRHSHPNFMQPFFQDFYIESNRIPHTNILVGNSRPGVGVEGAQSPYNLPFINRSQISRNLANARKFGVRVRGDYSFLDYDTGFYSSCTNFTDFFPGYEYDGWVNIKPLGKTDGRYGKLVTGTGLQSGVKHGTSYYLTGGYVGYEYKKAWTKLEYARANGSNGGSGLTNKHSQGLFWTIGYHLTKKLEVLARYDQFDPDRDIKNNNQKEYTLGANYYLKGQALKLIFNYIYCQNDSKVDSHKLMVGTQVIL